MKSTDWKLRPGRTWSDKLRETHPNHGRIVPASEAQRKKGVQHVLIPRPMQVDAAVRRVPKGRLLTVEQLRATVVATLGLTWLAR